MNMDKMNMDKMMRKVGILLIFIILLHIPFLHLKVTGPGGITPADQRGHLKPKVNHRAEPFYVPSSAVYYVSNLAEFIQIPFRFGTFDVQLSWLETSIQQGKMMREERIESSRLNYDQNVYQAVEKRTLRDLDIEDINFESFRGSSAGMMLSLQLIQEADGKDLTRGHMIVGTGAVDAHGNILPVGGIKEKVQSAHRGDADLFFVPDGTNALEAQAAAERFGADFEIIAVKHLDEVLDALAEFHSDVLK